MAQVRADVDEEAHLAARGGFTIPEKAAAAYTDEEMAMKYGVDDWDEPSQ
ncbi:hypothetical protein L13192_07945 [Pyrenophora tritici-repentis]|nr:hypothetical protein L13192_12743 [Pyrenophora tritici-repentis]KAI1663361.1 hypothetical protein L13192_12566 [Pyrenophora tritici-repentis]KAI1668809.1 hypothetical protein L13192_07945 [Pyrenophora tritici-repentis]